MDKYIRINIKVLIIFLLIMVNFLPGNTKKGNSISYLQNYLRIASENNPGLKAAFYEWKAELERVLQVKSLPDPNFNFAYFISEVETKVGAQRMKVGLMQKFPWFGKLKLKGKIAFERSQALKNSFEKLKTEIFYKVKKLYYDYYFASKSIEILKENLLLMNSVSKQIRTSYSTGTASYLNLIRIQIELEKLFDRIKSLGNKLPSIRVALNLILDRPITEEININSNINEIGFNLDSSKLLNQLRIHNPELKQIDHLAKSNKANVKLKKKNYYPDISIGADYIFTDDSIVPGIIDSGKDPFLLKVGLNLPLRLKKINSSIREAKLKLEAIKYKRADKENKLISDLETTLFHFNDSIRIVNLYKDSLIPKAKQAFEVLKAAFSTGKVSFIDFVDIQRTLLDFELLLERSKTKSYQSLALIERLTGTKIKNINNGIN